MPADRRRYLRLLRADGQSVAAGPDGQPLRFETLAESAADALWADVATGPRRPLSPGTVLDAAAAGAIPLSVPWTWVETCCHVWPPGNTGLGPATAVLASLDIVRRHSLDVPVALAALDRFAGPLLAHALMELRLLADQHRTRRRERLDGEVGTLCKCLAAGMSVDEVAAFIELGAMDLLRDAADVLADQLLTIGRRFAGYLTEWSAGAADARKAVERWRLTSHWATGWCRAFDVLGPTLLDRFVREIGATQLPSETAGLVYRLASDLHDTPAERRSEQRAILSAGVPLVVERLSAAAGVPARAVITEQFCAAFAAADVAATAGLPIGTDARDLFAAVFVAGKTRKFLDYLGHADQVAMAGLAMGNADRLAALARLPGNGAVNGGVSAVDAAHVGAGWAFLRGLDQRLAQAVSAAVGRELMTMRVVRAVARLGLCLRFHRGDDLRASLAGGLATADGPEDPLAELARWRGDLPGRVREALERPAALRRELDGLQRKRDLSDSAARRVEHLRRQLADPAALVAWVGRDLAKVLPAALDEARIARLEATADGAIRGHFRDVLGVRLPADLSPAAQRKWDNALRLYLTVDRNRIRLRWLLRRESRGDRSWMTTEPRNAAFLAAVARSGVDVAVWRGAMVRHAVNGAGRPLRIELETDPLHVLQMGNHFGTCLSEGNMNAFSTVANATDANKRVAYVYDGRGTVVGRKLLVMTTRGQIVGFRTYGTSDGPDAPDIDRSAAEKDHNHLKRLLDGFCGELARLCGANLHPCDGGAVDEPDSDEMRLAAEWYNDGAEPFDPRHTVRAVGRSGIARKGKMPRGR